MKIKCKGECGHALFGLTLEVTVRADGSFYEDHVLDFKLDEPEKFLFCGDCGDKVTITVEDE